MDFIPSPFVFFRLDDEDVEEDKDHFENSRSFPNDASFNFTSFAKSPGANPVASIYSDVISVEESRKSHTHTHRDRHTLSLLCLCLIPSVPLGVLE